MVLMVSADACMQVVQGSNPTDGWKVGESQYLSFIFFNLACYSKSLFHASSSQTEVRFLVFSIINKNMHGHVMFHDRKYCDSPYKSLVISGA